MLGMTTSIAAVRVNPMFLDRKGAAQYCALSETTLKKSVREDKFPAPRVLSGRRVGWMVSELDAWCQLRPVSNLPPPPNTSRKVKSSKPALQA